MPAHDRGLRAAVIGAGPSGLSCAYFLALQGFGVEIFESKKFAGGMASDAIPSFRLDDEALEIDIASIMDLGVMVASGPLHRPGRVQAAARGV